MTLKFLVDADLPRSLAELLLVQIWAERAVKAAKIVRYPRNDTDPRVREALWVETMDRRLPFEFLGWLGAGSTDSAITR